MSLQAKLEEYGMLDDVTRMEFADTDQMAFLYQDRVSVLLGTRNDLDYKLDRARYVLTNADGKGCAPRPTPADWISAMSSAGSTRKIYFAQGQPTLPSGYVVPEKTEEPAPSRDTSPRIPRQTESARMPRPSLRTIRRQLRKKRPADRPRPHDRQRTKKTPCDKNVLRSVQYETGTTDGRCALYSGAGQSGYRDRGYHLRQPQGGTGPFSFVCIVGTQRDSHEFAADCAAKGVSALVIQHDIDLSALPDVTVVRVESSRYAMALMSANLFSATRPAR